VINRYTKNLIIRNQVLFVELKSPVVRQELMMQREELIRKLNKETGATVITDIKFR
jgi:predicted nucleic acid-binding Zn ribbon protein